MTPMNDSKQKAETIAIQSPEGKPANPDLGSKSMLAMLLMFPSAVILISAIIWIIFGPFEALIAFAVGMVVSLIANPTMWAMAQRAKDRQAVE